MNGFCAQSRGRLTGGLLIGLLLFAATSATGGSYRDSAHGNAVYGVNRTDLDARYADYATGNCSHCHEMHASLAGSNPNPAGVPGPHALFAPAFNDTRTQAPYQVADNFCFYCHSDGSGQGVRNQDYSTTFGGGTTGQGPQSIMAAFNQTSYHNLYDVKRFLELDTTFSTWFARRSNPCSGCHDSHKARRNWDSLRTEVPLMSAISRPGSNQLWGENEVMAGYIGYEAPYYLFGISREPSQVGNENGGNTPDYVTFCLSCHNPDKTVWSTVLSRNLRPINWGQSGLNPNKHGGVARDGQVSLREPYLSAMAQKSNFVMSCLDCHEPHGSENIMLLRTRINGGALAQPVDSSAMFGHACGRCHQDDLEAQAGTSSANRWEYVHHGAPGAPYGKSACINCHATEAGGTPIDCGNCHGHGMDDSSASPNHTGRMTF